MNDEPVAYDPWGGPDTDSAAMREFRQALVTLIRCAPRSWTKVIPAVAAETGVTAEHLHHLSLDAQAQADALGNAPAAQDHLRAKLEELLREAMITWGDGWPEHLARAIAIAAHHDTWSLDLLADAAVQQAATAHQRRQERPA